MYRSFAYALAACFLLAGCSTYTQRSTQIKDALANDEFPKALEQTEEINKSTSELLYLYEKGLILHSEGRYDESNAALQAAELLYEDLYTKSVVREAGAFVISDQTTTFRGEAFETTYVNYYKMLNYWYLGSTEGALVEARRLNDKIKFLPDREDSVYVESPFLQWLTGMMYEIDNERNNADVSYRNAVTAYEAQVGWLGIPAPSALACDLVANAAALGDRDAQARYGAACETDSTAGKGSGTQVTLFIECGYVAHKISNELIIPIYKGEMDADDYSDAAFARELSSRVGQPRRTVKLDYILKVALPGLVNRPSSYARANVRAVGADGTIERDFALGDDLNVWAEKAFEVKLPRAIFRAILRGLIKYAAKKKADKENEGLGFLVNLFGAATEVADTRTWSTLPERIFVTHLTLPPGTWNLEVEVFNSVGNRVTGLKVPEFEVAGEERIFLNYRVH